MPKVPRHLHQVNCFQEGVLEFDGPMGQCFSRFPTVSSGRRGEKGKKIRDKIKIHIVTFWIHSSCHDM